MACPDRAPLGGAAAAALLLLPWLGAQGAEVLLPGHSISNPPDISHLARMWYLTGTVMPSHKSLILTPGVAHRVGTIFSRTPLQTNDFEVSFTFSALARNPDQFENDGFAFWLSEENSTAVLHDASVNHTHNQDELIAGTWLSGYTKEGMGLLGYKNNYKGVGVFFLNGKDGKTVSIKKNDGTLNPSVGAGLPDPNQAKIDYQNGQDYKVKIRVKPDAIDVNIEGDGGQSAGSLKLATNTQPGTYIGLSCYGGDKETYNPAAERSAMLELKGLKATNFASGQGEDLSRVPEQPAAKQLSEQEKEDILGAHSSFKDHRDESEAIKELTNMVFKLVIETKPQRDQMKNAIASLSKRIESVEKSFASLKAEIDKKTGHKLSEEFEAIKKELVDIHAVAHKDHTDRGKKLESLHSDIADVHKTAASGGELSGHLDTLSKSNAQVIDQLTNEHQRMFGISIFAIAFIIIAGLSLYNKFRCWEKKHVL